MTQQQKDESKADYLADNRKYIIELKSLVSDPNYRVEEVLNPHRSERRFSIYCW